MRVATFADERGESWGVIDGDRLLDARAVAGAPTDVLELLRLGDAPRWLDLIARSNLVSSWREGQLLAPIPRPGQDLIALGLNYVEHVDETNAATKQVAPPTVPIVFGKAGSSVVGPFDEIRVDRAVTNQVDWEVELAAVIGRGGRDIPAADALEHVFGYTVANDVSARDLQFLDGRQWYRGKSLDTFCPIGPWVVTRDEIPEPGRLRLELRVNGVVKQFGTTADLLFDLPAIIASVSAGRTLYPGDIILTGTPGGVGIGRTPPEFLKDGDIVEAEIERIGVIRNRVVDVPAPAAGAPYDGASRAIAR